eukprot:Nk52_evm35s359 gene=Nk52_evmTU35s359
MNGDSTLSEIAPVGRGEKDYRRQREFKLATVNLVDHPELLMGNGTIVDELHQAVSATIKKNKRGITNITSNNNKTGFEQAARSNLKFSVKLFVNMQTSANDVLEAAQHALEETQMEKIDHLLLAFELNGFNGDEKEKKDYLEECFAKVSNLWQSMEELVFDYGIVQNLGISNVHDASQLQTLVSNSRLRPSTVQVRLSNFCGCIDDIVSLGATHGIRVVSHNDSADLLDRSGNVLEQNGFVNTTTTPNSNSKVDVLPKWVAQYNIQIIDRSIMTHRGYILKSSVLF